MVRVKRGNVARVRRKKILNLAKGFRGSRSRLTRTSMSSVMKALEHSYRGRKRRKSYFRSLCIGRISGFLTEHNYTNLNYSTFKGLQREAQIGLNLKMLAQLAVLDPGTFTLMMDEWPKRPL